MVFSDSSTKQGIVEQVRSFMRVDSIQWPTAKIVASVNNYHDLVTGFAIGADKTFQWDDTNHTKLPEGTAALTINVADYSFLTDEQGNSILTLLGVSRLDATTNKYVPLEEVDRTEVDTGYFGTTSGTPTAYDKIADNIIRLDYLPPATVASGLKFFFQRTGSYFTASDTTKSPGVAPVLHRGYVIAAAYDGALTLGLENLNALGIELKREEQKMEMYFNRDRNRDKDTRMQMRPINFR